jgi:hypothetical protein
LDRNMYVEIFSSGLTSTPIGGLFARKGAITNLARILLLEKTMLVT